MNEEMNVVMSERSEQWIERLINIEYHVPLILGPFVTD